MCNLLSHDEIEFLFREVIIAGSKKKPLKELAILECLFQACEKGADVDDISSHMKEYHIRNDSQFQTYDNKEYFEIKKDIDKLKHSINEKLSRYYLSRGYSIPCKMVIIDTCQTSGRVRYILRETNQAHTLTYPLLVAYKDINSNLMHSEYADLISEKPKKIDYMGTLFIYGFGNTTFCNMMLDNMKNHQDSMYRILLLHPESPVLAKKIEIYERVNSIKADLMSRIRLCEERYKEIKSNLPAEHKNKINMRYCRRTPFMWSRFLIIPDKRLHFRVTLPESKEKVKCVYSPRTVMYRFAVDAFEIMWSDENSEPAPEP